MPEGMARMLAMPLTEVAGRAVAVSLFPSESVTNEVGEPGPDLGPRLLELGLARLPDELGSAAPAAPPDVRPPLRAYTSVTLATSACRSSSESGAPAGAGCRYTYGGLFSGTYPGKLSHGRYADRERELERAVRPAAIGLYKWTIKASMVRGPHPHPHSE